MADIADLHAPSAAPTRAPELHEATILDDAQARGEEVRCTGAWLGDGLASDPMQWNPQTRIDGEHWPKRGDRAIVTAHDGPPAIVEWWPAADAAPDLTK